MFCFCCICCGCFYFNERWCLFQPFFVALITWKSYHRWSMPDAQWTSDVRCPMHGELRMLDGRCPMHVLLKVDRRCPMHAEVPIAVVRPSTHAEVPKHVRTSGPLFTACRSLILIGFWLYWDTAFYYIVVPNIRWASGSNDKIRIFLERPEQVTSQTLWDSQKVPVPARPCVYTCGEINKHSLKFKLLTL